MELSVVRLINWCETRQAAPRPPTDCIGKLDRYNDQMLTETVEIHAYKFVCQ
jgi:hypothetical protein